MSQMPENLFNTPEYGLLLNTGRQKWSYVWVRCWKHVLYGFLLNIRHYLLMVRQGISPAPNSIVSAKTPDHVTTMMHDEALVHYLIHETYSNHRFYQFTTNSSPKSGSLSSAVYQWSKSIRLYWYMRSQSGYTLNIYSSKKRGRMSQMPVYILCLPVIKK